MIWEAFKRERMGVDGIQVKRVNRWTGGREEIIREWGLDVELD